MISIKKLQFNIFFFINFTFCLFPLSYILGNLFLNLNLIVFLLFGILYLKKKIFDFRTDFFFSLIIVFFFLILFSTIKNYDGENLTNIYKSLGLLRFLVLLVIVDLLNKFNAINFRFFFYSTAFFVTALALDVIYQYIFGFDIFGFESNSPRRNPGFFGKDEPVAGGFIERFAFFSIFLIFLHASKKKLKFTFITSIIIYTMLMGGFLAGDRMPILLLVFGLIILFSFVYEFRKSIFFAFSVFLITVTLLISTNDHIKYNYWSFYTFAKKTTISLFNKLGQNEKITTKTYQNEDKNNQSLLQKVIDNEIEFILVSAGFNSHQALFLTAIDTWRMNKIFGGGLKSFRKDCVLIIESRYKYRGDYHKLLSSNRSCSNHPHNYYLEILTESGLTGLSIIVFLFLSLLVFAFKFLSSNNFKLNEKNLLILAAFLCLILEMFPIKSSGSFFSTQNATYITIITSIVMSGRKFKIN